MPVRLPPLGRARKPAAARAGLLGHDPFFLHGAGRHLCNGCLLYTSFFGGVISDFIGRRKTFLISIATFSFFSVLNGFTDNFHVFVIARSMTGFGVFCLMVCSQAYIAEMAPAESRGKWQNLSLIHIEMCIRDSFGIRLRGYA